MFEVRAERRDEGNGVKVEDGKPVDPPTLGSSSTVLHPWKSQSSASYQV